MTTTLNLEVPSNSSPMVKRILALVAVKVISRVDLKPDKIIISEEKV